MKSGLPAFRALLEGWLLKTSLFPTENLVIDLILNPEAGALKHPRLLARIIGALHEAPRRVPPPPLWSDRQVRISTWVTEAAGDERQILAHLYATDPIGSGQRRLVVIAGGDGTSRGALISALALPLELRSGLLFFRLPLGTGNDAAELRDWALALDALSGRSTLAAAPRPLPVLEVRPRGLPVQYSFNIASVGLDAFVAHLTNRFKARFPGNSYSLMVDAAAFFYEAFVQVVPTVIELSRQGTVTLRRTEAFLLAALGTTGHKTYGSGKRVLPDQDNFCWAGRRSLLSKLAYRRPFYTGTHRGLEGVHLAAGDTLRVESPVRLPLQMDGEVLWLDREQFPLTMQVTDHGLTVLGLAGGSP